MNNKEFNCSLCGMTSKFEYFGKKPPSAKNFVFIERVFCIQDPFGSKNSVLAIGANCSECHKEVCMDRSCSIFYCKRFCGMCAKNMKSKFPAEMHGEINRLAVG